MRAQTCCHHSFAGMHGMQGMMSIQAEETPGPASWPKPTSRRDVGLACNVPSPEPQRGVGDGAALAAR